MQTTNDGMRLVELGYRQVLRLDSGGGQRVRVLSGTTLLTQEGDLDEATLGQGGELVLHDGRTLIEALQPALVQIACGPARRRQYAPFPFPRTPL